MKEFFNAFINFFRTLFGKDEIIVSQPNNSVTDSDVVSPTDDNVIVETTNDEIQPKEQPKVKILIDNGHGIDTVGKKSPFCIGKVPPVIIFEEWKWNREIAKELCNMLNNHGFDADILVPEVKDISLSERVKRVNDACSKYGKNNVILISIHANASGDGSKWMTAHGWSAYTSKGKTKSDNLAECFYDAAEKLLYKDDIRKDLSDGDRDFEEDFTILAKTKCAAILTENFFYDNTSDASFLLSQGGKDKIIKIHFQGIASYITKYMK